MKHLHAIQPPTPYPYTTVLSEEEYDLIEEDPDGLRWGNLRDIWIEDEGLRGLWIEDRANEPYVINLSEDYPDAQRRYLAEDLTYIRSQETGSRYAIHPECIVDNGMRGLTFQTIADNRVQLGL